MSKSERLFELLTLLRAKRYAVTAKDLADTMQVSERTIYRDIQSLLNSGVPIQGEAGVGYMLQAGSHLPPLMFSEKEMMARELGMRMVRAWSDTELADASRSASARILSVLPDKLKQQVEISCLTTMCSQKPQNADNCCATPSITTLKSAWIMKMRTGK